MEINKVKSKPGLLLLLLLLHLGHGREILFLISCPQLKAHSCQSLQENLRQQISELTEIPTDYDYAIKVHIMHELFNYWTLLDSLGYLQSRTRMLNANTDWIIWCQHNTHVSSLQRLLQQLSQLNAQELAYYGHALHDAEATIVHHFAHYKNPTWFPYPMLGAGVIFTGNLLRSLAELVAVNALNASRHSEFSIDASHELARFIFDNLAPSVPNVANDNDDDADDVSTGNNSTKSIKSKSKGNRNKNDGKDLIQAKIILKSAAYICPSASMSPSWSLTSPEKPSFARTTTTLGETEQAAKLKSATELKPESEPEPEPKSEPVSCVLHAKSEMATGNSVHCVHTTATHIYFAIKTCAKFHKERVPIIERTWAANARHRKYYSDVADADIPTISIGLPNVPTGHCAKTLAILQLSLKDIRQFKDIRWLMLVDDDTLLSVHRLSNLLSCYNHTEHIYLGERYGYRLYAPDGFNYHTGGAGIVLSVPLVELIVEHCSCPTPNAPDDMILGYCLQALGVPALHSFGFHQARPQDYAPELLHLNAPISFHKYWQTNPEHTYKRWLGGTLGNGSHVRHVAGQDQQATPMQLTGHDLLQLANNNMARGLDGNTKHLDL